MNPTCSELHAGVASLRLNQHCLHCLHATLASPSTLPTLRRAALSYMRALVKTPDLLLRRAPHLPPQLILGILASYEILFLKGEVDFGKEVVVVVVELAYALDGVAGGCMLVEVLCGWAVDAMNRGRGKEGFLVLAECLRANKDLERDGVYEAFGKGLGGRGEVLVEEVLRSAEGGLWKEVGVVVHAVLALGEIDGGKLLQTIMRFLPGRAGMESDYVLLEVALRVKNCEELLGSNVFLEVMKRCVIVKDLELRGLVTKVVCNACETIGFAEWLCEGGVFDYVVESVREIGEGRSEKILLTFAVQCLEAIIVCRPMGLEMRWCYCLEVVFAACGNATDVVKVRSAIRVICEALEWAPVAAVTEVALQSFVAFGMTVLSRMCHSLGDEKQRSEEENIYREVFRMAIQNWVQFLQQYRPSVLMIHTLIGMCEAGVQPRCQLPIVFALLAQLVRTFKVLVSVDDVGEKNKSVFRDLGQRLIYVIFEISASALEDNSNIFQGAPATIQRIRDTTDIENVVLGDETVEDLYWVLDMLANGLDPIFVSSQSCGKNDQDGMRAWCWRFFPPHAVFSIPKEVDGLSTGSCGKKSSMKWREISCYYLWRITSGQEVQRNVLNSTLPSVPTTEDCFLESLVNHGCDPDLFAMALLDKSISYDSVHLLCSPDQITDALSAGLQLLSSESSNEIGPRQSLRWLQTLCHLCSRYTLAFRELDIPPNIWQKTLRNVDLVLVDPINIPIFCQFLCRGFRDSTDVFAWDKFSRAFQSYGDRNGNHTKLIARTFVESVEAASSVIYAISNSSQPQSIADCVFDLLEASNVGHNAVTSLEQGGAIHTLCNMLQEVPTILLEIARPDDERCIDLNKIENGFLRVQSLISLIIQKGEVNAILTNWSLLRLVCETIIKACMSAVRNKDITHLSRSLIRWLIASIRGTENKQVWSFVFQTGVAPRVMEQLRIAPTGRRDYSQDDFEAVGACFLVLLLQCEDIHIKRLNPCVMGLLRDTPMWERLLCSTSHLHGSNYCRVINCCYLLNCILLQTTLRKTDRVEFCPRRAQVLISVAASSEDILLREAALTLLGTIMELQTEQCSRSDAFAVHLALSACVFAKFCSPTAEEMSAVEVRYMAAAVFCGHADDSIAAVQAALSHWLELTKEHPNRKDLNFSHLMRRNLLALQTHVEHRQKHVQSGHECNDNSRSACSKHLREYYPSKLAHPTEVLFGRYAIALRSIC